MKAKIFAKLKQEYSSLGLGDEYLMSKAESLAATGLVTDDNIDAVVACQRKELEGLQKANDKRVTDALEKERKKHEEETRKKEQEAEEARALLSLAGIAEARKKAEEEAKKKGEPKPQPDNDMASVLKRMEEMEEANKQREAQYTATIKTLTDKNTELGKTVKELSDKNAEAEAAAAKAARTAMIQAKAKELGVPDWRIEEGFNLAEDATEEVITEKLTQVANNINTNLLPGTKNIFPLSGNDPTKEELASMAASIVK